MRFCKRGGGYKGFGCFVSFPQITNIQILKWPSPPDALAQIAVTNFCHVPSASFTVPDAFLTPAVSILYRNLPWKILAPMVVSLYVYVFLLYFALKRAVQERCKIPNFLVFFLSFSLDFVIVM